MTGNLQGVSQNSSDSEDHSFSLHGDAWRITWIGLHVVYSLVVMTFNALVIYAVVIKRLISKDSHFIFLASLALSDLIVGVFWWTRIITSNVPDDHEALVPLCATFMLLTGHCVMTTVYTILALAVDQYIKIVYPLQYPSLMTRQRAIVVAALPWLVSITKDLFTLLSMDKDAMEHTHCTYMDVVSTGFLWFLLISHALLPYTVIVFLQVTVLRIARRHLREIHDQQIEVLHIHIENDQGDNSSHQKPKVTRKQWKAFKTTFLIIGLHGFCLFTFLIAVIVHLADPEAAHDLGGYWLSLVGSITFSCHSWINPIIYSMKVPEIKKQFIYLSRTLRSWARETQVESALQHSSSST